MAEEVYTTQSEEYNGKCVCCDAPANGHVQDYCQDCSDVRCDAYPGECRGEYVAYYG